jgi:SAM-dependent methyltransferase
LLEAPIKILHCAPEPIIQGCLRGLANVDYASVDLDSPLAELHADLTKLPLEDDRFDLVIASHVLEHITDERAALREIRRILRPGGIAVLLVPLHSGLETTLEDETVQTPAARLAIYGQADHVRLYGRDFVSRVASAGFDVTERNLWRELERHQTLRYGLVEHDSLFICSPT